MRIGDHIKEERKKCKLTGTELGLLLDPENTKSGAASLISRFESNKKPQLPTLEEASKLEGYFKIPRGSLSSLLDGGAEEIPSALQPYPSRDPMLGRTLDQYEKRIDEQTERINRLANKIERAEAVLSERMNNLEVFLKERMKKIEEKDKDQDERIVRCVRRIDLHEKSLLECYGEDKFTPLGKLRQTGT